MTSYTQYLFSNIKPDTSIEENFFDRIFSPEQQDNKNCQNKMKKSINNKSFNQN